MTSSAQPTIYGYCRLSLDRRDTVSIDVQQQAIRGYVAHRFRAARGKAPRIVWIIDRGVSGAIALSRREQGRIMTTRAMRGDQIVTAKLDRIFRSVADCALLLREFEARGVGLHLLDLQVDTTTPVGRCVAHMVAAVAQMERERIGERRRDAAAFRRERGDVMHPRRLPPVGWRVVGRRGRERYVREARERRELRRILRLHLQGFGLRKLLQLAESERWRFRGRPWSQTTLRRALRAVRAGFPTHSERAGKWEIPPLPAATRRKLRRSQYRRGEFRGHDETR